MAYQGFGDVSAWWGLYQSSKDVYLYRFEATNIPEEGGRPRSPVDLMDFVSAVGRAQSRNLDIRAVTAWKHPSAGTGQFTIDVVATSVYTLPTTTWNEPDLLQVIKNDPDVGIHFPGIGLANGGWHQITSPEGTIDFWRSRPVLWDHSLTSNTGGHGGPTAAFGLPPEYAVTSGRADDPVSALRNLAPGKLPVGPGEKPGGSVPAGQQGTSGMSWAELLIGVSIAGMIVWAVRSPGSRKYHDEEYG